MIPEQTRKHIQQNEKNIQNNYLKPFLPRIVRWIKKADSTPDKFDKYLTLFIATNISYNLWAKIKNPQHSETHIGDKNNFMALRELIENHDVFLHKIDVRSLVKILDDNNLIVKIKIKNRKNKKCEDEGLAQDLLRKNQNNSEKTIEYIWETLYITRCNLVHGEKGYEERQIKSLDCCSKMLRRILIKTIKSIIQVCNSNYNLDAELAKSVNNFTETSNSTD